jgi:hypothetical protein
LKRWTGLDVTQWDGARLEVMLGDSVKAHVTHQVTFIASDARWLEREPYALRHFAGLASMRRRCQVSSAALWRVSTQERHAFHEPDALWIKDKQWIAVEYDAGGYDIERLRAKTGAFRTLYGFGAQVWGCSSAARVNKLNGLLSPLGGVAFHAPWRDALHP